MSPIKLECFVLFDDETQQVKVKSRYLQQRRQQKHMRPEDLDSFYCSYQLTKETVPKDLPDTGIYFDISDHLEGLCQWWSSPPSAVIREKGSKISSIYKKGSKISELWMKF